MVSVIKYFGLVHLLGRLVTVGRGANEHIQYDGLYQLDLGEVHLPFMVKHTNLLNMKRLSRGVKPVGRPIGNHRMNPAFPWSWAGMHCVLLEGC